MCFVSLLHHHQARRPLNVAKGRRAPETAAKLPCSGLVTLPALGALVLLVGGGMVQGQEISTPILLSGLRGAAPAPPAIEKLSQRPVVEPLFDAAKTPPIESIGAGSDIRPFLAFGVPEDLTRAALRRAWSADPAIRDFVGLSENSWDFNAPGGSPEFYSVARSDAGRPLAGATKETESLDPEHLAAERLANDRLPVLTGEASRPPSSAQGR